jgi:hypothetical protein
VLWPALLAEPLAVMATAMANGPGRAADGIEQTLGALTGRLMRPGGWIEASHDAGAEIFWTRRPAPYAESTLRKRVRMLARAGGTTVVERAVQAQVATAVTATEGTARVVAYTDLFDAVYWSDARRLLMDP